MSRTPIAVALPLLLALTAACGGGGATADRGQAGASAPGPPTTTAGAPGAGVYPLTGMPAVDPAKAGRRAVAVKIDNSTLARPQSGIDRADIVYEEFTEGITRFVVVFQSSDSALVGPVRSVRPGDPSIVKPLGGLLAFSGGSPGVLDVVQAAGIAQVTEDDKATLKRRSGKRAPHNLYTDSDLLFRKAGAGAPPPAFSAFTAPGAPSTASGATPAVSLRIAATPRVTAQYQWDAGAGVWKRSTDGSPHVLEDGAQISPRNVIVQYTPYAAFPADQKVQFPEVVGSGDAVVFVAGTQVKARWSKPDAGAVTAFTDSAGKPIALTPGQTWVHLQAPGSAVVVG